MGNDIRTGEGMIQRSVVPVGNTTVFSSAESFNLAWHMADVLARSSIVPSIYQGNPSNCLIAIEMASRIKTSPMMVMQNLYIVHGNPAWSSQWIIAMINNSRRYKTELKFDIAYDEKGKPVSCRAWAEDYNGNRVEGPLITMEMARAEGWVSKNAAKWNNMTEVMIRYRAASFFGRLNCPDMIMGIYSQEEVVDAFGDRAEEVKKARIPQRREENMAETVVEAEAVPSEEDGRKITQEERQIFMNAIAENFEGPDARNSVFKKILGEIGVKSTAHMTVAQLGTAISLVEKYAKEGAGEETPEPEAVNDVQTDGEPVETEG